MENNKTLEILKQAIILESRGKSFYASIAQQTNDADVKQIFEIMAAEEDEHLKFLTNQYKKFIHDNKFGEFQIPQDAYGDGTAEMILTEKIKNQISGSGFESAAISAAIDMENRAIEIYASRAASADSENEKLFYAWLADWERSHHKILHELDEQLKEKVWFDNNFWAF